MTIAPPLSQRGGLADLADRVGASRRLTGRVVLALAVLAGLFVALSGAGGMLENGLASWRAELRARPASGRLVFVEIDARSLQAVDRWPWPRSLYGRAVQALARAGADTVAFDIDLSDRSSPAEDAAFAREIAASPVPVVLPTFRQTASQTGGGRVENLELPEFTAHAQLASVNIRLDPDGFVRTYPYGVITGGLPRPSVGATLAGAAGRAGVAFPIDSAIRPETIPRISFIDLIDGRVAPGSLKGKSVLVGASAIELNDRYPVPVHGVLPGAVIQLLAAETLLAGSSPVDHGWILPLVLALAAAALALRRPRQRTALLFGAIGGGLLLLPMALELARLGTVEIVPGLAALGVAGALTLLISALHAARQARLIDLDTRLPNRRALDLALAAPPGALVVGRIAGYSDVAGVMGQARAVELILRIADRIALGSAGAVYRVEDNALAWFLGEAQAEDHAAQIEAAAALLRAPFEIGGRQIELRFAFGLMLPQALAEGGDAIGHALLAADHAAARGERWEAYTTDLDRESDWRLGLAGELDRAIAAGHLWVAYQPKYDLREGRITAAEALVRWNHPARGPISPDAFIPALEDNGRILDLTLHVLETAVTDARRWAAAGHAIGVAVNVSALLPSDPAFVAGLKAVLARHPVEPGRLTLEVTESAAMADPEAAIPALERIAAMGLKLSIDDYGTGQSTLSYLKRLPAGEIKIDKSFVLPLETSRGDQAMVRSTIGLAHELGYAVVAEGVENGAVLDMLREFGCDEAQGWHIGRPVSADAFLDRLGEEERRAA